MRALQLLLYARARKHLPATRALYGRYLICFGTGGSALAVLARRRQLAAIRRLDGRPGRRRRWRYEHARAERRVPLNASHLAERFQLFVLIVLGESVARLISAATLRSWSVPLAVVLTAAVVTLAMLWWAWNRSADHAALSGPPVIAWFAAANLPIVAGIAAASAGLHIAILAADGAATIGIGPRAALYGGVSVCLLASAIMPSGKLTRVARATRLATSAGVMGLVSWARSSCRYTWCRPSPRGARRQPPHRSPPSAEAAWLARALDCA